MESASIPIRLSIFTTVSSPSSFSILKVSVSDTLVKEGDDLMLADDRFAPASVRSSTLSMSRTLWNFLMSDIIADSVR